MGIVCEDQQGMGEDCRSIGATGEDERLRNVRNSVCVSICVRSVGCFELSTSRTFAGAISWFTKLQPIARHATGAYLVAQVCNPLAEYNVVILTER